MAVGVAKVKRSRPFTVLDCVLTAALVALIALSVWLIYRVPAATVVITSPDTNAELPLDADADVPLDGLTVHIRSGEVWVTDAACPDKVCERTGRIRYSGQSIVCLPAGITVTITGGDLQWGLG